MKSKVVILSGAGVSAESGINTFRGSDGLWEGHRIEEVASPIGWANNRKKVLDFYNLRRAQLKEVKPNKAHFTIAKMENNFDVTVVTQNVDNLHEKAGSTNVMHLHGELTKVRSTINENLIYRWEDDLNEGHTCELGSQLRPHIVWFGEAVPLIEKAAEIVQSADIIIIVGTSMKVYPAAGLIGFAKPDSKIFYIDPSPGSAYELDRTEFVNIKEKATKGFDILIEKHLNNI